MSKKRKLFLKFLYYFFISLVLLALAAVCLGIIFYASGYQFNWKARKIEKTGMLMINSQEDSLKIFIDKKQVEAVQSRSVVVLSSSYTLTILPGEYDLEIQKDGRIPYDERIKIEPELVTKISDVLLLPDKISDENILTREMTSYSFSPDNKKIVYQTPDNKVLTYNINTAGEKMLDEKTIPEKIASYTWEVNSGRVALKINKKEGNYYYILDPENLQNSFFLQDKVSSSLFFDSIYFSNFNPDEFFGINKNTLYKINTHSSQTEKIADDISHFIQKKSFFYFLDKDASLIQYDPRSYRATIILEKFELSDDFDLVELNNAGDIFIKNKGTLYKINDKNDLALIDKAVEDLVAAESQNQFLYTREFEIWIYDSNTKQSKMVTRFSKKIENLQEFFNSRYLIYQQGKDIEAIKKDGKNNQTVHNDVENVRVFDKNKIIVVEQKDNQKVFKIIDLTVK
ncbi:MAG: hypothetical protein PHU42_01690 [Patescibacteria group bacterium]|nr:hypothetical protein [Patescibacteria group bacterium]